MDKFIDRRQRAGSLNNLEEVLKRKREEDANSINQQTEKQNIFKKSFLTVRSPGKEKQGMSTMDEILKKLCLLDDIKTELRELKESNKSLQKSNEELKNEIRRTQETLNLENKKLKDKVNILEEKLNIIELREEQREKKERKNNIIISQPYKDGFDKSGRGVKEYAKNLLKDLVGENIQIKNANFLTKNRAEMMVLRVTFETFEEKLKIMKQKSKLKGTRTFITDDLTKKEGEIQKQLREWAKEEIKKGNRAFIGYQKININGKWIKWTENE